jgi:quercetin dioxygenase-like cupin family protein
MAPGTEYRVDFERAIGSYSQKGAHMIVTSQEGRKRNFLGVDFVVLAHGPETMITKMLYKETDSPPLHAHPNEQSGYVISGEYRIIFGSHNQVLRPGDSYSIPRDTEHRIEVIAPGEVLDFFSPPRKDYM